METFWRNVLPITLNQFLITALFTVFVTPSHAANIRVIDGDTVHVDGEKIRIANIDTAEIRGHKCDAELKLALDAKARAIELLGDGDFEIVRGDPDTGRMTDRWGRTLAVILVDGRDFGAILIEEGLARPWEGRRKPWCE